MSRVRILKSLASGYAKNALNGVLSPGTVDPQLHLVSGKLLNFSGGASDVGLFRGLGNGINLYSLVGTTLTDITAALPATIISTANNDGFLVGSNEKFGLVGFVVSQAEAGSPVYTYKYWNGSSFATLTTYAVPTTYGTSAEVLIVFAPPSDWAVGGAITSVTGISQTKYNIYMKATTAPSTAVIVSRFYAAQPIDYQPNLADKTAFSWQSVTPELSLNLNSGDYLLPYFATANAKNMVMAQYWVQ